MRARPRRGVMVVVVAAAALSGGGCFADYGNDCSRNVDLDCFWAGASGGGGSGGAGPICGNGVIDSGEACDDGNTDDCDGCNANCSAEESCGDGVVCAPEECDQGSANSDMGACTSQCKNAACGDGFVQAGEECDPGNGSDPACVDCKLACTAGNLPVGGNPEVNVKAYLDDETLHCYVRVANSKRSWSAARSACQLWGGDLAALSTSEEIALVIGGLSVPGNVWTGGNDQAMPNTFVWSNGEPWQANPPWGSGQPDDAGAGANSQACVELEPDSRFYDVDCSTLEGYLCEREIAKPQ